MSRPLFVDHIVIEPEHVLARVPPRNLVAVMSDEGLYEVAIPIELLLRA